MNKLNNDFYTRTDVLKISKELLGKVLHTHINGVHTSGIIVETEAYNGIIDKASHAYGGKRTARTETMYSHGGVSYIYLCYGIHHLFNVVTNVKDVPHAVLIRAIEPLEGIDTMLKRRQKTKLDTNLTSGPGSLTKALGITTEFNAASLDGDMIWISDNSITIPDNEIIASPRIGVVYAKEDALLPYRFRIKENKWCSPAK